MLRQAGADDLAAPFIAVVMIGLDAGQLGDRELCLSRKRPALCAYVVPSMLGLKRNRGRRREERRDVAAALPLVTVHESRWTWIARRPAPAHDERLQQRLRVRPRV